MYFKKTIIMSALDGSADKAVLNVERYKTRIEGQIRLYNYKAEPVGILTLGFLKNGKVIKAGLQKTENMKYSFVIENNVDMALLQDDSSVSCALIHICEGKAKPLLYGASDGSLPKSYELKLASALDVLEEQPTVNNVQQTLDANDIDYDEQTKAEIESVIDQNLHCNKCSECKYRQAFYSIQEQEQEQKQSNNDFYNDVKQQLDELFEKYPEEEFLKDVIPNSKWVKVELDDQTSYYVVGLIYEDGNLRYICYGVPGMQQQQPPQDLGDYAQWLPVNPLQQDGFGYWLCYQDAQNGENIKMSVI